MDTCSLLEQQAYFKACLEPTLAATIQDQLLDTTPVVTEWVQDEDGDEGDVVAKEQSAMLILNEVFVFTYPFYNRRYDYYRAKQPSGMTATDWVRKLQQQKDECALSLMSDEEKFVHRILTSLRDETLVKELLKLDEPNLQKVIQEIHRYEVNSKKLKVTNKPATTSNNANAKTPTNKANSHNKSKSSSQKTSNKQNTTPSSQSTPQTYQCYRCGHKDKSHTCRAKESTCKTCGKKGHYAGMCKSKTTSKANQASTSSTTNAATVKNSTD